MLKISAMNVTIIKIPMRMKIKRLSKL